jgi:hypothetical protein
LRSVAAAAITNGKQAGQQASQPKHIVNGSHCDFEQHCKALQSIAKHYALQSIARIRKCFALLCVGTNRSNVGANLLRCKKTMRVRAKRPSLLLTSSVGDHSSHVKLRPTQSRGSAQNEFSSNE